jgi:IS1 family transposase
MRAYSNWQWHLDEVFVKINGETHYRWRAVDHDGDVLESFVTKRRDRSAAYKLLRKIMKLHGRAGVFVTDKLRSYGAAMKETGNADRQETGRWPNNRAKNSHYTASRMEPELLVLTRWFGTIAGTCMIRVYFSSSEERLELDACVRSQREDHGIARRANAIVLLDDGESCAQIGKFLYLDDDTIRGWFKTYQAQGWDGLSPDGWRGGQSRMTTAQQDELCVSGFRTVCRSSRA